MSGKSLYIKSTGKPLALTWIRRQQGGSDLLRKVGLYEYSKLSQKTIDALTQSSGEITNLSTRAEAVEMSELPIIVQQVDDTVALMFRGIDAPIEGSEFTLRELRGLNNAIRTYRGELVNNHGKLKAPDENIAAEEAKLKNLPQDNENRLAIKNWFKSLCDERSSRLDATSASSAALRAQMCQIRELDSHWRYNPCRAYTNSIWKQGVTIFSILTALDLAISTLDLALTGSSSGATSTPEPAPSNKGVVKKWINTKSLGHMLSWLGEKTLSALHGLIGTTVSWLFKTACVTVGWLASNPWALILAFGWACIQGSSGIS